MAKNTKPKQPDLPTIAQFAKSQYAVKDGKRLEGDDLNVAFEEFVDKLKSEFEDDEVQEGAEPDGKLSYPPHPRKDKTTKILRGKWRDQGRVKCAHAKCAYPLNVVMVQGERQPITVPDGHEHEGEAAYKAVCSWDPRHMHPEDDSTQYVTHKQLYPPDDVGDEDVT